MKKYLLLIFALTMALSASTPTVADQESPLTLTGFYAGISGGVVQQKTSCEFKVSIGQSLTEATRTSTGFSYGLMAGYGNVINRFYLGAEIAVQSDTMNETKQYKWKLNNAPGNFFINAQYKRGAVFSVSPRFGLVFADSCMIYVKPALELSHDKITISLNDSYPISSDKKIIYSFVPSIGVEKACHKNIIVRAEYNYNLGGKIKGRNIWDESLTLKYTSHSVKLGLAYKF